MATKKPKWLRHAQKKVAATKKKAIAQERRKAIAEQRKRRSEEQTEAKKIIAGLKEKIEDAAEGGSEEVKIMSLDSSHETLRSLEGAAKLVVQYCRNIGLKVTIKVEYGGTDMAGDSIPDHTFLVAEL